MDKDTYLQEMLLALDANIKFLQQEGNSQLRIHNGLLTNVVGELYIYTFNLEFLQELEPDVDVEVRVGYHSASGRVIAVNDKEIQIQLDKNIGPSIEEAKLIVSNYYLLQLLYDKLKSVKENEIQLSDYSSKVFGLIPFQSKSDETYVIPPSVTNPPNPYQEEAIRLSLGSEVTFIWGPPGTGKTETIAKIIEGIISQNKSVLLLSNTNTATDGALLDFIKRIGLSNEDYVNGKILRIGSIQKEELKKYENVVVSKVIEMKMSPIREEITRISKEIDKYTAECSKIEEQRRVFTLIEGLKTQFTNLQGYLSQKQNRKRNLKNNLSTIKNDLSNIESKITKYYASGSISRLFSGLNIDSLTKEKASCLENISSIKKQLASIEKELDEAGLKLLQVGKKIEGKEKTVKDITRQVLIEQLKDLKKCIKEKSNQRDCLAKQIQEIENIVVKEAKVIATTLTKSHTSKTVLEREYDCIILDEASMAPLPALWYATGLAKEKVIIVGDFYQLPPIVKHKVVKEKNKTKEEEELEESLVEKWLRTDIFHFVGIDNLIESGEVPHYLTQLKIQYRMHPHIADVVNELSYNKGGGKFALESAPNTYENGDALIDKEPLSGAHIGLYTTDNVGTIASRTDSGSYFNIYHALISVRLAEVAIQNGYKNIGIVSPFRAQTNLIQKMIKDKNLIGVVADTVHKFQGGEKQLIIFDLTTANPTNLTDDDKYGGDDEKLLNVAFSRAKEKCMMVADISAVNKKHSASSFVRKYIDYCVKGGYPQLPSDTLITEYEVLETTESWLKRINNIDVLRNEAETSTLYDENDFYKSFYQDLLQAEKEVIIDSPYITKDRVSKLLTILDFLIKKNVKIFILTRVPKEHDDTMREQAEEQIKILEEIGVKVLVFVGFIHRKLAIIDRKVLWEGSLNILSHRDSHEIMRRFNGEETATQVVTFLKLDKNIGEIGEDHIEKCEFCNKPGSWYWTDRSLYGGMWTFCLSGMHKKGAPPKSVEELKEKKYKLQELRKLKKEYNVDGVPICPEHHIPMVLRKSRYGELWGCSKYPRCKIIEKIH